MIFKPPAHFNANDPAHCNACFKEGERRIIAAVIDNLRERGVLSKRGKWSLVYEEQSEAKPVNPLQKFLTRG